MRAIVRSAWLSNPSAPPPAIDNAVVVAVDGEEARVVPAGGLPFVPALPVDRVEAQFEHIEIVEYRDRRWTTAAAHRPVRSRRMMTRACAPARWCALGES